ncbi:hypothetical protein ONZ45_g5918 [Pleurotus djamor]|nr:hypothetical protein ONZ45_g5918 [Pleurotus djamor]
MRSDSPVDFLPLDAALISFVRQSLRVDGHHIIFQRDYLYDFFRAMLDIYKDLFPVHLNMLLKNKQTFSASMPRDIHPSLFEVVESAIDSGNLQLIRDLRELFRGHEPHHYYYISLILLAFYSVPPPLKAQWLPGVPDLNIVWERASKGVWLQPLRDAIGSQFSVLHPSLGLQSVHKTPIVVLEEYNDMWETFQYMYQQRRRQHSRLFFVGHSGIGKSTFLQYATARACSEHHHFILASTNPSDHIFYFDGKNYPRVLSGDDFTRTAHATRAFILLDTQPAHPVPPSIFHNLDLLIVVSTSPQLECWEWARKDHTRRFFHVKLPSAKDLNNISEVSVNASSKPKLSLFPYIGPCIRELIQVVSQESASQECSENALTVAINCIIGAPFTAKGQRDAFYSLFFISPPSSLQVFHHRGEPLRLQTSFRPRYTITTALHYQILRDVFRPLEFRTENSTLLSSSSNNHPAYGIVFEKEVLDRIQRGDLTDTFELEPGKPRRLPSKLQELLPGYALEMDAPPPHHHRDKWDASQSYLSTSRMPSH